MDTDHTLDLDASPVTLRLPAGSSIFVLRGEAWITQERMREDVILAAGQRFDVTRRDAIVVSATRSRALLHVLPPCGACQRAFAHLHDVARCRAAELRSAELDRLRAAIGAFTGRVARNLQHRVRAALAPRPRADAH